MVAPCCGVDELAQLHAFAAELFRQYSPAVLAYALHKGIGPADADDAVAETFVVCLRRISEVPEDALPWLFGVARRVVGHQFRTEKRITALKAKLERAATHATTISDASRLVGKTPALAALEQLRPREQELMRLAVLEGFSHQDIARATGLTCKAVEGRLARTRSKLRNMLLAD